MWIVWIIIVMVLIFAAFKALKTHFVCTKCGKNFKIGIMKYIFTIHILGKRLVKCPECGHIELLLPEWDKEQ
ncbi:DNA-directed RNA polymerase subunit RPC12/RpoP [Clostridium saccharoperbutylacetonicum]|uniref:Uncharacterized protein n=1 Tax=Clostridium saccharoperbutylacetonicum N1-4(HMT) TaxID=931276 RepID=M1M8W5_9CLOT|nr:MULTISPECIES: hypothetical protein [Clostridium]AGF54379.1 hypothetical protein Cspa_c05870 [Clostridium saccharoperbutylacetonicum N1-4(HMT)]NRT59102.1 DNA-directed RNA polymerase subunit RPC12/RpoP [Clostridium saccharoperbutylacetonicum]NSB28291.1 DNA-directed RNA polymerase subunit RPC12/RpoP [Clostridium saccharoperbutylacetonicum]NSB41778.1 DNA-directed RNA polymerase subunit RPC12/RpoP [Clostridium saccharoperbutylacetonicum]